MRYGELDSPPREAMKPCHSLKFLWHSLHCKVLLCHKTHRLKRSCLAMASASSNLKQQKKLLVNPSCIRKAGSYHTKTHQGPLYVKYCHLHGHCRCSHTEAFTCVPYDHECLHIEASACVSDGHGCSSSFDNGDTLCDHSECFSDRHNVASGDVFATTEILSDDVGRDVVNESYDKYVNNCVADGITSLSITDSCDITSHDKARTLVFDGIVRKSSTNGNVVHGPSTMSMLDVNGCHGSVDGVDKETQHWNGDLKKGHTNISSENGAKKIMHICNGCEIQKWAPRPFCRRCEKAQDLCICNRIKGIVQNKIKITILQNPKEKHHAVGSARVALLGLENIALIDAPEIDSKESFRIHPKVPGSKRNLAGRGGKKILLKGGKLPVMAHNIVPSQEEVLHIRNLLMEIFDTKSNHLNVLETSQFPSFPNENGENAHQDKMHESMHSGGIIRAKDGIIHNSRPPEEILKGNVLCGGHSNEDNSGVGRGFLCLEELESLIPPGVALLYPSDKAIELLEPLQNLGSDNEQEMKAPCHLIVLDGTWSKAKRIYFENPWLQSLPHYKLSLSSPSLYEGVRKQPKPGCLSTLESIVYALKVLEPDTEGLDGLLEVFDSMVEDQRRCKQMKCLVQEYGMK